MRSAVTTAIVLTGFLIVLALVAGALAAPSLNSPNATSTPVLPLYCPAYPAPYPADDGCHYGYLPAVMQGDSVQPTSTPVPFPLPTYTPETPPTAAWLVKELPTDVPAD